MDWQRIRGNKFAVEPPPPDWPEHVVPISISGVSLFGLHKKTGDLYWDGKKVQTKAKLETFERVLAFAVAASTVILAGIEIARFYFEMSAL